MKWFPRPKFISVSPWLLAAATALLVLIVVTFAVSNMQREKRLMTNAMLQKAATLMRVIKSGARASYVSDLRRGIWQPDPWYEHVQRVIDHLSDDPDIAFLAVIDGQGTILAHSRVHMRGRILPHTPVDRLFSGKDSSRYIYRIIEEKGQERFFEVLHPFAPFQPVLPPFPFSLQELHRQFSFPEDFLRKQQRHDAGSGRYYVVVAEKMKGYDSALRRLRFQVLMLSLTMLLVGIGGWLSLAAVHGYRVSQKTLGDIRAFTGLLVSKLPVGIIATNEKGTIATWNQAAAQLTGISAEEATGRRPSEVLPPLLAAFFSQQARRNRGFQGACEVELSVHGEDVVLNCHHLSITDQEGAFAGEVLLLGDMTELKKLEKEMRRTERLAAVGRMAAGVAHEVRNPLSSVKGLALLLRGRFSDESDGHAAANMLVQEVERINRTVSELLSFARPAPLHLTRVDMAAMLTSQIKLLGADTSTEHISIELDIEDDLPAVAADEDRLRQVIFNVLLNGVQALDGQGWIRISARTSENGQRVVIDIEDSGVGMDEETLSQAFYPYFTTKKGGSGIGLAISQKIMNDHGGNIFLASSPGQGTTVTLELPVFRLNP